jgi:hypothetical protein
MSTRYYSLKDMPKNILAELKLISQNVLTVDAVYTIIDTC